ncbi:MFS transporter [Micromonospora sp. NPDC003197]
MSGATQPRAGRREWIGLVVLLLPLLLVSMDVSVLYFAVPFISRELTPTSTEQLWIFDIYGFVLAGLLLTMGAIGDRIGRRRLLLIGAAAFGLASVAAAYATSPELLIAARALLGIGGATLMPSTLALIRNMFHDDKQRGTAIAIWSAVLTGGVAIGPVISGLLLDHFWWGSVFLINLPAMVLLLVLAPVLVPEFKPARTGRFDWISAVLSLSAVLPAIYGIKEIAAHGVDLTRLLIIAAGLVLAVLFIWRQRIAGNPMIDPALFRNRGFGSSVLTNLVAMFAIVGFAIFTTQYLQSVLGMRPLEAALWSLVPSLGVSVAAPLSPMLAQRINRAYLISAGFLIAVVGFVVLAQVQVDSPLWVVLTGAGVFAAGTAVVMTLITDLVVGTAPPEQAGTASALVECSSEFGGALGMAVLGSIGLAVYRDEVTDGVPGGLPADAVAGVRETLAGATVVAEGLPGPVGDALLVGARLAFVHGMQVAAVTAAVVMALAAVVSLLALRRVRPVQLGGDTHRLSPPAWSSAEATDPARSSASVG